MLIRSMSYNASGVTVTSSLGVSYTATGAQVKTVVAKAGGVANLVAAIVAKLGNSAVDASEIFAAVDASTGVVTALAIGPNASSGNGS